MLAVTARRAVPNSPRHQLGDIAVVIPT